MNAKKAKALREMTYRGNDTNQRMYHTDPKTGQIINEGLRSVLGNAKKVFNELTWKEKGYRNKDGK